MILAKTQTRVPYADEVEPPEEPPEELKSLLQAQTQTPPSPVEPEDESSQEEILTDNKDLTEVGVKTPWLILIANILKVQCCLGIDPPLYRI